MQVTLTIPVSTAQEAVAYALHNGEKPKTFAAFKKIVEDYVKHNGSEPEDWGEAEDLEERWEEMKMDHWMEKAEPIVKQFYK